VVLVGSLICDRDAEYDGAGVGIESPASYVAVASEMCLALFRQLKHLVVRWHPVFGDVTFVGKSQQRRAEPRAGNRRRAGANRPLTHIPFDIQFSLGRCHLGDRLGVCARYVELLPMRENILQGCNMMVPTSAVALFIRGANRPDHADIMQKGRA
jgi:hypothetical protein